MRDTQVCQVTGRVKVASKGRPRGRPIRKRVDLASAVLHYLPFHGPVAQLIERFVRNEEVVGLIPIGSTISQCEMVSAVANGEGGRPRPKGNQRARNEKWYRMWLLAVSESLGEKLAKLFSRFALDVTWD